MSDVLYYACLLLGWWATGFLCAVLYVGIWSCLDSVRHGFPFRASFVIACRVVRATVFSAAGVQTAFAGPFVPAFLLHEQRKRHKKLRGTP